MRAGLGIQGIIGLLVPGVVRHGSRRLAIEWARQILVRTKRLAANDPRRNIINATLLRSLLPFASLPQPVRNLDGIPKVERKETVLILSLAPSIDVGINEARSTITIHSGSKGINQFFAGRNCVGLPSKLISLGPRGFVGNLFRRSLDYASIPVSDAYLMSVNGIMRVVFHLSGEVYTSPGTKISEVDRVRILQSFRGQARRHDWIVLAGSLYPGIPADTLLNLLSEFGANKKVIIDSRTLWERVFDAANPPFLLKPNMGEFVRMAQAYFPDESQGLSENSSADDALPIARRIVSEKGVKILVISKDKYPFIVVTPTVELSVTPPVIQKDSDKGSGDALIAGMLDILTRHQIGRNLEGIDTETIIAAVRRGTALAAASAEQPGTSFARDESRIRQLESRVIISMIT